MGCGKTHVADQCLQRHVSKSVLVLTFRRSLATYLAERFKISHYLEDDIWHASNATKRERLVVCLDSIGKFEKDDYDIVLSDEGIYFHCYRLSKKRTRSLFPLMQ